MARAYHFLVPIAFFLLELAYSAASLDPAAQCRLIEAQLPNRVSYPESLAYNESISSYYSGQESDLRPGCIFSPKSASEVSQFVKIINSRHGHPGGLKFAIRSGGHTIWSGAANIEAGITVDLRAMNSVVLSEDRTTVSLGAGGIWSEIYKQLVPHNLTVMGGRVAGIGVGGLATGGGINYLSRRNGWVCDNIFSYEVVLASGDIVMASASSHEDLWLALKGGSNNFGIVTRFDAPTWPIGDILGGSLVFNYSQIVLDAHAVAFSDYMNPANFDDASDMGLALIFQDGAYVVGDSLFYVEPVEEPEVYRPFLSIPEQVANGLHLADVGTITSEAGGTLPPGMPRAIDIVYSFKNGDASVYSELFRTWEEGTKALASVEGLQLILLIQPHPVTNGTNSLGLDPEDKDLVMSVLTAAYANRNDDDVVQAGMEAIIAKHEQITSEKGLYIPFKYLNYADKSQDPIGSYGPGIKAQLQAVSRKYDSNGLFQMGVPGGFKLFK